MLYAYRVRGPEDREGAIPDGHAFDETKVVLDPYAKYGNITFFCSRFVYCMLFD